MSSRDLEPELHLQELDPEMADRARLPVPMDLAPQPDPLTSWRVAAARIDSYLNALAVSMPSRQRVVQRILSRVARRPDWASGHRIAALAMTELHRWLARGEITDACSIEAIKASARPRMGLWLHPEDSSLDSPPVPRYSAPRMLRTAMVPSKLERNPLRAVWRLIRGETA